MKVSTDSSNRQTCPLY